MAAGTPGYRPTFTEGIIAQEDHWIRSMYRDFFQHKMKLPLEEAIKRADELFKWLVDNR